ncbi:hypothetical protein DT57C_000013 [Escherichia phage DT57C]|uniref:Uncharacterized protein n=2 Tax=Tequintavirus TaxID=187218 RepID=A0A0A7RSP5_9CAUD|nr:hypothetical protein ACQ32_gp013 [Escherichia phage DT57C]YP_009784865.1 hypothetical protein HOR00_gp013 [Escherichia phage DT571/2]AJA41533.1 hypothetical protein DT57C_000013 [Escherichia phage DT57C]AJA41666.1 hypothetical protein DT5712_000013 [Escherichia phage DT571/2]
MGYMIEEANKFKNILALAVTADHKCLSELEPEVKHAVMFVCEMFPAKWEGKKIKFDINAPQADLAYSYVDMNKVLKSLDPTAKGHRANFLHVIIDEPLPTYPEANVRQALEAYPEQLLIPPKKCKFDHLPALAFETSITFEDIYRTIGAVVARIAVAHHRDIELTTAEDYILYAIHDEKDSFKRLMDALGLGSLTALVLNQAPRTKRYAKGSITLEETGSTSSFLATYIYLASKGIYLKARKNVTI